MNLYDPIGRWRFPLNVLPDSISAMASDGRQGNEGLVLWLGRVACNEATVTHLVTIPDCWVTKRPDFLRVAPAALNALIDFTEPLDVSLIGQIHSHPGTFVDLSLVDRKYGISAPYYLSVVAPHYAQRANTTWDECGIHQFVPSIGFRRLSPFEAHERLSVLLDARATSIVLEEK